MIQRMLNTLAGLGVSLEGRTLVLGVSGGADSVCLLKLLCRVKDQLHMDLQVVHVHHGLRGETALRDARFVEELCREHGIKCHTFYEDIPALAARWHMSHEEAGRRRRYAIFEQVRRQVQGDYIATAHHKNDQAETFLFQLVRGSSLPGLCAIAPVKGRILRPLLCFTREEIEGYLQAEGTSWMEDETNLENAYTRNRIRHELLPVMTEHINPRAVEHISDTVEELQQISACLSAVENSLADRYIHRDDKGILVDEGLAAEDPYMVRRLFYRALACYPSGNRDLCRGHYEQLFRLLHKEPGKELSLPGRRTARREQGGVYIFPEEETLILPELPLIIPGRIEAEGLVLEASLESYNGEEIPELSYTKWLDYDRITCTPVLRKRRPGDYIILDSEGHRKRMKDYYIDRKIPRHQRDEVWLVAAGPEVLWIVGGRISARCRITEDTRRVLKVRITGEYLDERKS